MSANSVLVTFLLAAAVVVDVLAVTGLAIMRTPMQRLHFIGPVVCVAPVFTAVAVLIGTHATPSQAGKGALIALVLVLFGGVLSHETGRAIVARAESGE